MAKLVLTVRRRVKSLVGRIAGERAVVEVVEEPAVDLGPISAAVHYGCMGLPQELIDHIMDTLHDDPRTLKACSLACKAMFASTRHLVHRTLYLTRRNNQRVLTLEEKYRYLRFDYHDIELRFLSVMGERGFLQYARRVYIRMDHVFTPDVLIPHLDHFRSLDQVHSLTIEDYDAILWRNSHGLSFAHFYPTLTSLTLRNPLYHYRYVLQFALQFPNLLNLCIERPEYSEWVRSGLTPPIIDKSPPLRGHLRLAGIGVVQWPTEFAKKLPSGINFRSVELQDVVWDHCQSIVTACAGSLEDLTIAHRRHPNAEFLYFNYGGNTVLRRLTIRVAFPHMSSLPFWLSLEALSTIASPVFCEFVLETGKLPSQFSRPSTEHWGRWERIDRFFAERFAERGDFRMIIRTGKLYDRGTFQTHAKERFPLLAERGCVLFETSHSVDQQWR